MFRYQRNALAVNLFRDNCNSWTWVRGSLCNSDTSGWEASWLLLITILNDWVLTLSLGLITLGNVLGILIPQGLWDLAERKSTIQIVTQKRKKELSYRSVEWSPLWLSTSLDPSTTVRSSGLSPIFIFWSKSSYSIDSNAIYVKFKWNCIPHYNADDNHLLLILIFPSKYQLSKCLLYWIMPSERLPDLRHLDLSWLNLQKEPLEYLLYSWI